MIKIYQWLSDNQEWLVLLGTITAGIFAFVKRERLKNNLGLFATIAGAFFGFVIAVHNKVESKKSKHAADSLSAINDSLQRKLLSRTDTIIKGQGDQINSLRSFASKTIDRLEAVTKNLGTVTDVQNKTLNNVVGSKKHPIIDITILPKYKTNEVTFRAVNNDEIPIRAIEFDFPLTYEHIDSLTFQQGPLFRYERKLDVSMKVTKIINDLYKNNPQVVLIDHFPNNLGVVQYTVMFRWQNKKFFAMFDLLANNGRYTMNHLLVSDGKSKNIIPSEYVTFNNNFSLYNPSDWKRK